MRAPHPVLSSLAVAAFAVALQVYGETARTLFGTVGAAIPSILVGWLALGVTYRRHPWFSAVLGMIAAAAVFGLQIIGDT